MRDLDGRTYAAASVALPAPVAVRARGVRRDGDRVRVARPRGRGASSRRPTALRRWPRRGTSPATGVPVHVGDARGTIEETRLPPDYRGTLASVETCARGRVGATIGDGVARLLESYAALPGDAPVRLAKPTSNLFRGAPRRRAGLDVSGLDRVDRGRRRRRRGAGHVHLRAPGRGDPRARPDPARRAAAPHHHARRRGHRARHRVDQLPQRPAARVGARDGRADRLRRDRHDPARRRPVRRLPQLLRLARLRHAAAHRARARLAVRRTCGTCASTTADARRGDRGDRRHRRVGRRARRRARRRRLRTRRGLPDPRPLDRRARARPATTAGSRSSTARSSSARPTG